MNKKIIILIIFLLSVTFLFSQETYYNDVNLNLTGITLKNELATKITTTHTNFLTYTPDVWEASKATDVNPSNSAEVLLIYGYSATGNTSRTRGINQNGGNSGDWNREHVFPRSLGDPNLGTVGAGADAHNLRPADGTINSLRSNKKFAIGSGNSGDSSGGWYPGDEWKGDVARMMMYMYVRYGNQCLPTAVGIGSNSATPDDMIDLFLQWNVDDPVSDFEKQRNTYHENTSNTYAQGNRNPFIDNPILATRIWGGPVAEDTWGIYTTGDTENPTTPTNIVLSNITTFSIDVSWDPSTDNIGVASYDVYINGNLIVNTTNTTFSATGLASNTTYGFSIVAKDIANNQSAQSTIVNGTTLEDTESPTIPTNITISNETDTSFKITWTASTDNTGVTGYDIYIDGSFNSSTSITEYTVTGLNSTTTYEVTILAKDAVNNQSAQSTPVNATTTDGSTGTSTELFFSEYVEGSGNNKALEIANVTNAPINLSGYSIKRNGNGGNTWSNPFNLSGTIASGDVYVIINGSATLQTLIDEADFVQPNNNSTNFAEPINFNGNDPVGLFKNDVLIDIIGVFNNGSANFAKDITLRRKSTISSPNTSFNLDNEWDEYPQNTVDDIGQHNTTLSIDKNFINSLKIYPNPLKGNTLFFKVNQNITLNIYNILGKKVLTAKISQTKNQVNISQLNKGIYLIKITSDNQSVIRKLIKE